MIGVSTENVPSSPLQLPFIRILNAGRPMVHTFLVISGFVLSEEPLENWRARIGVTGSSLHVRSFPSLALLYEIALSVVRHI